MIKLFTGSDHNKALIAFTAEAGQASLIVNPDNFDANQLAELAAGESLFGERVIVSARDLNTWAKAREAVVDLAQLLQDSSNLFLFLETGDKNSLANALGEISGVEVKNFNKKEAAAKAFNPFAMTDALIARDRKQLWLNFQTARRQGLSVEEIFPPLSWQAKNMLLVAVSKPDDNLDLKPFVLSKAKQALRNYSPLELKKLFANLIELHQSTYPNSDEFELGLEKLILTI